MGKVDILYLLYIHLAPLKYSSRNDVIEAFMKFKNPELMWLFIF